MHIDTALSIFEAGHMTRNEAAGMFVWLLQHHPDRAAQYHDAINGLIQSNHIVNNAGVWVAADPQNKKKSGRPRGSKPRQRVVIYLDPAMVAEIENHKLANMVSRNDLIKMLLRFALDRNK